MSKFTDFQKKSISSDKLGRQIIGSLLEWNPTSFWAFVLLVVPLSVGISFVISSGDLTSCLMFICLNIVVWLVVKVCRRLMDIFSLRKNDHGITWCYIIILLALGIWVIGFLLIFNTKENSGIAAAIGAIGIVLSWIFQDKIKGVMAFLHLRTHHLLNIGDWIQVPGKNVDGEIKKITLTSVTICNWDTTTSVIPIGLLSTEHFINLQNMMLGKTYGRRMLKTFTLDTGWFHLLTQEEAEDLKTIGDIVQYLPADEIKVNMSNAQLFRMYLYHWLMNHSHVSQHPSLVVRWLEQVENGMPLQIYAFITDSSMVSFEWQQSNIIEHVIKSLDWFGLRLYQSPSGYDVSNNSIYLTDKPATYRKEDIS